MKLLVDIGKAYETLATYNCRKAIELFENLPLHQLSTSWTMEKLAISYYECGDNEMVSFSSYPKKWCRKFVILFIGWLIELFEVISPFLTTMSCFEKVYY